MAKKRMNGEGSWTQRENGTWKLSVSYKGIGRKYFYGDKATCLKKKREFEALMGSNVVGEKDVIFKDFATSWITSVKQPLLKPTSYDRLERVLEQDLFPNIGDLSLKQIDGYIIQKFIINRMKEEGYSFSSIKLAYSVLGEILKYAVSRNKIDKNPIGDARIPKRTLFEEKERRFLSEKERDEFVKACYAKHKNGERIYKYGGFFVFLLYTGCRVGEGLALKWSDINLEKRTAFIGRTLIYTKDRSPSKYKTMLIDQPSTKSGTKRTIYLSDMAISALEDIIEQIGYGQDKYIIHADNNKPIHPNSAQDKFRRIIKRSGIEHCSLHALRHSFVSLMINNGVPITMVSQMVGHSSIDVTARVYSHLLKETQIESMSIIKELK